MQTIRKPRKPENLGELVKNYPHVRVIPPHVWPGKKVDGAIAYYIDTKHRVFVRTNTEHKQILMEGE